MVEFGYVDKRRKPETEVDRLSALPHSLLLIIIEHLGLKEAAQTAILSKQWRFLWTNLPFQFSNTSVDIDGKRSFVASVHAALALRRGPALRTLSVAFDYDSRFTSDVDSWLDFAAKNKAKRVSLLLRGHRYILPQFMYSNSSVTHLKLENCQASPEIPVQWRFLKSLTLQHVDLRQAIGEIISGCPLLQTLDLEWCSGFNRVEIGGRSFCGTLTVRQSEDLVDTPAPEPLLEISAPYMTVLFLIVRFNSFGRTLRFGNFPALRCAYIQLDVDDWGSASKVELRTNVENLLGLCHHCMNLFFFNRFAQGISILAADGWRLARVLRAEYLYIPVAPDLLTISGVVAMLESLPYIKKLDVGGLGPKEKDSINWGPIRRVDLNCDLTHLKVVQFFNFFDSSHSGEPTLTLAKILLKRAPFLEEMVIYTAVLSTEEHDNIKKILHSCPRSSQKATIVLHS